MGVGAAMSLPEPMMVWRQGSGDIAGPAQSAGLALTALQDRGWSWLQLDEVHIFPGFFEVETDDRGGVKGPEVYVNRSSGDAGPEMGPNMMWDTRVWSRQLRPIAGRERRAVDRQRRR